MCIFIGIEDLAANALIELLERTGKREISLEKLYEYGTVVVKILLDKGEEAALLLSKYGTNELIADYSDMFELRTDGTGANSIALKKQITADDLRKKFRVYLPLYLLRVFKDEKSVSVLGV